MDYQTQSPLKVDSNSGPSNLNLQEQDGVALMYAEGGPNDIDNMEKPLMYEDEGEPMEEMETWRRAAFRLVVVLVAFTVFIVFQYAPIFHKHVEYGEEAQQALGLLLGAAILWASEVLPLWVTSMTIPLVTICWALRVTDTNYEHLPPLLLTGDSLVKAVFGQMMGSEVVLIIGGFTIARAMNKVRLDRYFAVKLLSSVSSFRIFLLILMFLGAFFSMWMSNVVSPAVMCLLIAPAVKDLDRNTGKAVAIAIAYSNNIGGMLTPIASPQNEAAINQLERVDETVDFGHWMIVTLPVCTIELFFVWGLILWYYRPDNKNLPQLTPEKLVVDWRHWYVFVISTATIGLWCIYKVNGVENTFASLGTIGLIPLVFFFGSGFLGKEDLQSLDWDIFLLLGGGSVLGRVMNDSTLLAKLAKKVEEMLGDASHWTYYAVFNIIIMVPTNFFSHTVGAITILPIVADVGKTLGHARSMVVGGVLCCSGSCALPVSSFPNVISYALTDSKGRRFLDVMDYVKLGLVTQCVVYILNNTLAWGIFQGLGW